MTVETALIQPPCTIDTFPPTITEVYKGMNKIKAGKAPGICGIYPEYIQHGGSDAVCTLHKIVTQVWKEEVVPKEWHQGIIIPLYKGKGSKSECSSYRGITLPGKVFAHRVLYDNSVRCVRTGGTHSSWFKFEAGVHQGCVLAPDSFATGMDWLLDRTVESWSIGVAFGQSSFTDLVFADNVSLLNC